MAKPNTLAVADESLLLIVTLVKFSGNTESSFATTSCSDRPLLNTQEHAALALNPLIIGKKK